MKALKLETSAASLRLPQGLPDVLLQCSRVLQLLHGAEEEWLTSVRPREIMPPNT